MTFPRFRCIPTWFFQCLISSDGHDEVYSPDRLLENFSTSTTSISHLPLASLNTRSVSRKFETFEMDISKLNLDVLCLSENRHSSDTEMLYHVPSSDLFTNNRSTVGDGVSLYVSDTLNVTKLVIFFCNA